MEINASAPVDSAEGDDYQIWSYYSCCVDIAEHTLLNKDYKYLDAEHIINELRSRTLVDCIDDEYSLEYYIRKRNECTYLLYVHDGEKKNLYGIYYDAISADKKLEFLSNVAPKYKMIAGLETRDDRDIRGEL